MKVFFLGIFLIFTSCNSQKKVQNATSSDQNTTNELVLLIKDSYSGISTPEIQVIKEPSALKQFFSKINKTRKPGLAVPKIDFTKEMVIILCSGEQQGAGVSKITVKEETSTNLVFKVVDEKPLNESISSAITSPFYVYRRPLTYKKITFQKE